MYILSDTAASVAQALPVLATAQHLFLDCEGRNLGTAGGALSLLSIGTPHAEHIFLFDTVALDGAAMQPVLALLGSARTRKIVWDGRMDYSELYHVYATSPTNVVDLQIADVASRAKRKYTANHELLRLARGNGFPIKQVKKAAPQGLRALCGMDQAIAEHKVESIAKKDKTVSHMHATNASSMWMVRPLTPELLEYAASDIVRISALYDHFQAKGYLSPTKALLENSLRYVSLHVILGRPQQGDMYRRSGILPLEIIDNLHSVFPKRPCNKCGRALANASFGGDNPSCRVCHFLTVRSEMMEKYKAGVAARKNAAETSTGRGV